MILPSLRVPVVLFACTFASAALAEPVAEVFALDGEVVVVQANGTRVDAQKDLVLDSADTIVTKGDGAVIVYLHNHRLVRIDEDLELKVGDIVELKAADSAVPAADQLAALMYPGENPMNGAERVAGWQARITSADTMGTSTRPPKAQVPPGGGGSSAKGPPPPPTVQPPASSVGAGSAPTEPTITRGPPVTPPPEATAQLAADEAQSAPVIPTGGTTDPVATAWTVDQLTAAFGATGQLHQCLVSWRDVNGLPVESTTFVIKVDPKTHVVTRLSNPQAMSAPACLRDPLVGRVISGKGASFTVTAPLR